MGSSETLATLTTGLMCAGLAAGCSGGSSGGSASSSPTAAPASLSVRALSPSEGGTPGGNEVTISGSGFESGALVTLGGAPLTNLQRIDSATLRGTTPAGSLGAQDLVVRQGGQQATLASAFTYRGLGVSSVSPGAGILTGGTRLTISGVGFTPSTRVTLGGRPLLNLVVVDSTTITGVTPPGVSGALDLELSDAGQGASLPGAFAYLAAPTLTQIRPKVGFAGGGTQVTLVGSGFSAGTTARLGSASLSNLVVIDSSTITATTPPGAAGEVDLSLTSPAGSVSLRGAFRYQAWTSLGLPAAQIRALAVDPRSSAVYASTRAGVYKSVDGGQRWSSSAGALVTDVSTLAIDPVNPSTLYVSAVSGGLHKSTDGGASWTPLGGGLPSATWPWLVIDPSAPSTIYAAALGQRVWKSTDAGATWTQRSAGLPFQVFNVTLDALAPNTLYAGGFSGLVYKSTDGGASWATSNTGLSGAGVVTAVVVDPTSSARLYALGDNRGLYTSADGGASWSLLASASAFGTLPRRVVIDPSHPSTLYVTTSNRGAFKSTDGGSSWSSANVGLDHRQLTAIALDPRDPAKVYAGTSGVGVRRSSDGARTWSGALRGIPLSTPRVVALDPRSPSTIYVGTKGGGVHKSTDGGSSWASINSGIGHYDVEGLVIDPRDPARVFVGTNGGGHYRSLDGGANWTSINSGLNMFSARVVALAIDPNAPSTLYTGSKLDGLWKSTNSGDRWIFIGAPIGSADVRGITVDPRSSNVVYVATAGGLFRSLDAGATWSALNSGVTDARALAVDPNDSLLLYAVTGTGVHTSSDGGATWSVRNTGLTRINLNGIATDPRTSGVLYTGDGELMKSLDGGLSWFKAESGLSEIGAPKSFAVDPRAPGRIYLPASRALYATATGGQ